MNKSKLQTCVSQHQRQTSHGSIMVNPLTRLTNNQLDRPVATSILYQAISRRHRCQIINRQLPKRKHRFHHECNMCLKNAEQTTHERNHTRNRDHLKNDHTRNLGIDHLSIGHPSINRVNQEIRDLLDPHDLLDPLVNPRKAQIINQDQDRTDEPSAVRITQTTNHINQEQTDHQMATNDE